MRTCGERKTGRRAQLGTNEYTVVLQYLRILSGAMKDEGRDARQAVNEMQHLLAGRETVTGSHPGSNTADRPLKKAVSMLNADIKIEAGCRGYDKPPGKVTTPS
jgi:hypothetical protein